MSIPILFSKRQNIESIKKIAAQLIQCWASIVRPSFVDQLAELERLYSIAGVGNANPADFNDFDQNGDTFKTVLQSIASLFLLPYPNTPQSEQNWDKRQKMFTEERFT